MDRTAAAESALLEPASVQIGPFAVRPFSAGDMIVCSRLGLTLASGDITRTAAMSAQEQSQELMLIGALLCHPVAEIKSMVRALSPTFRDDILDVMFELSPAQNVQLLQYVVSFFTQAAAVSVDVELKPREGEGPEPSGK